MLRCPTGYYPSFFFLLILLLILNNNNENKPPQAEGISSQALLKKATMEHFQVSTLPRMLNLGQKWL